MALDSTHPQYNEHGEDWTLMRDFYSGERVVKGKGTTYLPATAGMLLDGMTAGQHGYACYEAYKLRAHFPDYTREAVEVLVGYLFQKDPTIELPAVLEPLRERATPMGESLLALMRRIMEQQLVAGRLGLLLDLPLRPDPAAPLPYIALYIAEAGINWNTEESGSTAELNFVVLDETRDVMGTDFTWKTVKRYRVLERTALDEGAPVYRAGVFEDGHDGGITYSAEVMQPPMVRGKTLEQIPFVFINSKDITPTPDDPPLLGLGRLCAAIYRGEADYRQSLYLQGQDTLVIVGDVRNAASPDGTLASEDAIRTGAGSRINVDMGGDAKYIGVSASGISEQRQALQYDHDRAKERAGKLITGPVPQESGEALKTRIAAQTVTLTQIAESCAYGLQAVLRIAAQWLGADPKTVVIKPNTDFTTIPFTPTELTQLMSARALGAPISKESIHAWLVEQGMTTKTFEEEQDLIAEEDAESAAKGEGDAAGGLGTAQEEQEDDATA